MYTQFSTVLAKPQAPKTVVAMEWMVEPVLVEAKRDSDGRFLKRNVKLATAPKVHSSADVDLASKYGADTDELFA